MRMNLSARSGLFRSKKHSHRRQHRLQISRPNRYHIVPLPIAWSCALVLALSGYGVCYGASGADSELPIASSNNMTDNTAPIRMSGAAVGPVLSAFSCSSSIEIGSATDVCTVKVSSASASGQSVSLSSSSAAVTVPATVTVPANATAAQFTAKVSSVLTAETVTLTANVGSSSMRLALQLNAYIRTLAVNRSAVAFLDVVVKTAATQSVTLTSTGTTPVTISTMAMTGTGFTISASTLPITLSPQQTATLSVQFHPTAAGVTTGKITIASNSSTNSTAVISLSGLALAGASAQGTTAGSFAYAGSPILNTLAPANPSAAISSKFFGMTVANLAPNSTYAAPGMTPFPAFPVSTLRLWDVVYWAMIQSYQGQSNWAKMDNSIAIAQQNGVGDFIFTFGRVPAWASTNPTDPCTNGEGPGSCAPPNMDAFDDFATQVVQRYCGKVKYYEPWNEPDGPAFWDGSNGQMLTIAQHVYQIAKDPANCGCTNGSCSPGGGANPNKVLMPSISALNPVNISWLNSYLAAAGTPYPYADIASFHGYVWHGYQPEQIVTGVQNLRQALAQYGLSNLELWNTEASFELDTYLNQDQQASWAMRYHAAQAALGVTRFIWYAYDQCSWGTLWSSPLCTANQGPTGQLTEAGTAYGTIENWFIGANLTQCQQYKNGLWTCELQRSGGYDAWMLWSSTGTNISVPVPQNLGLTVYRDWQGRVNSLPAELTVSQMPVLLENQ